MKMKISSLYQIRYIPVISQPVETLHARSLQGFRGLLETGVFNPDLVLYDTKFSFQSLLTADSTFVRYSFISHPAP